MTRHRIRNFTGAVVHPADAAYDEQRLGWHRAVDSRPALVATATTPADVRAAVLAARELGLPLGVQATGHGAIVAADGALLLRTAAMDAVEIDPHRRVARVGPGALWRAVNVEAARYGLAGLAGRCATVGVTGYTLGGGQSWLSRTFGFAADSMVAADVVTADGRQVTATAHRNAELFWALRGGGGNFGIVTSLEFRLFNLPRVYSGMSLYPLERAPDILAAYRDWAAGEPDTMNTAVLLLRDPRREGRRFAAIRAFGVADDGDERLAPLLKAAGPPVDDAFGWRPFPAASGATNGPDAPPMAARQEIELFRTLPDEVLAAAVEAGAPDSPLAFVELRHWGGAMARPAPDAGPAGHRDTEFSLMAVAPYLTPDRSGPDAVLDRLLARVRPHATGGSFLTLETDPAKTRAAFTPANYARLAALKHTWDPSDVFHLGHAISPTPAGEAASPTA